MGEIINELTEKIEEARTAKARRMNEIYYNLRMSAGDQQILWNETNHSYTRIDWGEYKQPPIMTFNMLSSFNLVFVSHLLTIDPQFQVMAATTEFADMQAARAAERYLDRIEQISHAPQEKVKIANLLAKAGVAYDLSYPDVKEEEVDIQGEALSPFEVFSPPGIPDCEDWPWVIVRKSRPKSYIRQKYNLDEDVPLEDDEGMAEYDLRRPPVETSKNAILSMFWSKNGQYVVFSGQTQLHSVEWPHDFLPVTAFSCLIVENNHWAHAPVDYAAPIQKLYNIISTMRISGAKRVAMPKLLLPTECQADREALESNLGGEICEYSGAMGHKPEYLIGRVGPDLQMIRNDLLQDMEACYGIHGYSRGEQPVSHTPAILYDAIVEKDTSKFKQVTTLWAESWKNIHYKRLRLAKTYLTAKKKFLLLGHNGESEVHAFDAAELSEGFDLQVVPGTDTYKSKAAQVQKLMMMVQQGLVERDPTTGRIDDAVWDALELGDVRPLEQRMAGATKQARAENEMIRKANPDQLGQLQAARDQIQQQMQQVQMASQQAMMLGDQEAIQQIQAAMQPLVAQLQQIEEAYFQIVPPTLPVYDHFGHHKEHQVEINGVAFLKYPPPIQRAYAEHQATHVPARPEAMINEMTPQGGANVQSQPAEMANQPAG